MTDNPSVTPDEVQRAAVHGLKWLFFATLIGGVALPLALLIWQAVTPNVVMQRAGVGQFVSASTDSGFLQPATTTVTTAQGSLIVVGLFSAPRNQPLEVVQWSQTSGLQLCAVGRPDTCLPMAGAWAGTLEPAPGRAGVFNFQGHGLSDRNVGVWLFFGCILALMTGIGWACAVAGSNKTDRSCEPPAIKGPGA